MGLNIFGTIVVSRFFDMKMTCEFILATCNTPKKKINNGCHLNLLSTVWVPNILSTISTFHSDIVKRNNFKFFWIAGYRINIKLYEVFECMPYFFKFFFRCHLKINYLIVKIYLNVIKNPIVIKLETNLLMLLIFIIFIIKYSLEYTYSNIL